jgi:hypothetical protein
VTVLDDEPALLLPEPRSSSSRRGSKGNSKAFAHRISKTKYLSVRCSNHITVHGDIAISAGSPDATLGVDFPKASLQNVGDGGGKEKSVSRLCSDRVTRQDLSLSRFERTEKGTEIADTGSRMYHPIPMLLIFDK